MTSLMDDAVGRDEDAEMTPLMSACQRNDVDQVQEILQHEVCYIGNYIGYSLYNITNDRCPLSAIPSVVYCL